MNNTSNTVIERDEVEHLGEPEKNAMPLSCISTVAVCETQVQELSVADGV